MIGREESIKIIHSLRKQIRDLKEENTHLKLNQEDMFQTHQDIQAELNVEIHKLKQQLGEERNKILKAIEYINITEVYNEEGGKGWLCELDYFDELLEILEGKDEETKEVKDNETIFYC